MKSLKIDWMFTKIPSKWNQKIKMKVSMKMWTNVWKLQEICGTCPMSEDHKVMSDIWRSQGHVRCLKVTVMSDVWRSCPISEGHKVMSDVWRSQGHVRYLKVTKSCPISEGHKVTQNYFVAYTNIKWNLSHYCDRFQINTCLKAFKKTWKYLYVMGNSCKMS